MHKRSKRDGTRASSLFIHTHSKGATGFTVLQSNNSTSMVLSIPIRRVRYVTPDFAGSHRENQWKPVREAPANLRTNRTTEQPHRPEFFIPQKYPLANLQMVSAASVQLDCNMSAS